MENKDRLSFDILTTDDMSAEEFARAKEEFYEKYPECPRDPRLDKLDIMIKREKAEQILSGKIKVDFVPFDDFYCKILYDGETFDFVDKMIEEGNTEAFCAQGVFFNSVKQVGFIHYHNYSNSWFLDVAVVNNDFLTVTDENVDFLNREFNCHELDNELKECNKKNLPDDKLPQKYYFVLGEVLDTNLNEGRVDTANKEPQAPQGNEKRLSFDILSTDDMTDEEFERAEAEFFEKYPECPYPKHVECLDLVTKRDWAEQILSGEKKIQLDLDNDFFCDRILDSETLDFVEKMREEKNEEALLAEGVFYNSIMQVDTIHFHSYANSWYVDVSVKENGLLAITDRSVAILHEEYDCHELDTELERCKTMCIPDEERPRRFFFVFDKVLDTNYK